MANRQLPIPRRQHFSPYLATLHQANEPRHLLVGRSTHECDGRVLSHSVVPLQQCPQHDPSAHLHIAHLRALMQLRKRGDCGYRHCAPNAQVHIRGSTWAAVMVEHTKNQFPLAIQNRAMPATLGARPHTRQHSRQ